MAISKKIRFEIFKRDGFICQYCGAKPPDITLEVDHIKPINDGGSDDINNLITSCFDCNRGKKHIKLEVLPQSLQDNIEILKLRKEQVEEYEHYCFWLENKKYESIHNIGEHFFNLFGVESTFSDYAIRSIKMFLPIFSESKIKDAMDIAYSRIGKKDNYENVFKYMCGILHNWRKNGVD